jgi:hypothetical protein
MGTIGVRVLLREIHAAQDVLKARIRPQWIQKGIDLQVLRHLRFLLKALFEPFNGTLITPFSSDRDQWIRSKCINIHDPDSPVYELADEYEPTRRYPRPFLCSWIPI